MNTHPAYNYTAVTPNDSTDLSGGPCRAIYVGTGGDVTVYPKGSTTEVTFKNVATGAVLPVVAQRIRATNTTATNLVALY